MNEETRSAIVTALYGAILLTQEAFEEKGESKRRANMLTKGFLTELVIKFTDILMDGDTQ